MEWNLSSPAKKQTNPSVFVNQHSEDGLTMEHPHQSECQEDKDYTHLDTSSEQTYTHPQAESMKQESHEQMVECVTNECCSQETNDRSLQDENKSQNVGSSTTLDEASTSSLLSCVPHWKWQAKDSSKKLWLPIDLKSPALYPNWFNGSFSETETNSWFSVKEWKPETHLETQSLQKTSYPSSMFSIAKSIEGENIKEPKKRTNKLRKSNKPVANMSKKIRLSFKPEDEAKVLKWFGSVRVTYNWALSCIKNKPSAYKCTSLPTLRKIFINKENIPKSKQYLLETPKHIRDSALDDLTQGFRTNFKKKKEDPSHNFEMKFRSRKDDQSITIGYSTGIKKWDTTNEEFSMYPTLLKNKIKFHTRKNKTLPDQIINDCKLVRDKLGRYYLIIIYCQEACENQTGSKKNEWCSIDPGVRTMLTAYSPSQGVCYKLGDNDISRIYRLCKHLDNLISKKNNCKNKDKRKKRKYNKPITRLRMRIRNLVTEVHCKAVHFIVNRFNNIIIPSFNVSQMVKKTNRKIRAKTVRQMICWRHFDFRQRLINTAKRYNVNVFVRSEEYTSKTCTHCQNVKYNLGGAKQYKCTQCKLVADRDVCGARNTFMMNTKTSNYTNVSVLPDT